MSRPSLVATEEEEVEFPRRWPGIGEWYQCETLPPVQAGYSSSRQAAVLQNEQDFVNSASLPPEAVTKLNGSASNEVEQKGSTSNSGVGYEYRVGGVLQDKETTVARNLGPTDMDWQADMQSWYEQKVRRKRRPPPLVRAGKRSKDQAAQTPVEALLANRTSLKTLKRKERNASGNWRKTFLELDQTTIVGDFRDPDESSADSHGDDEPEDLQKTWQAVGAGAQAILDQRQKTFLSEIAHFLQNAAKLPMIKPMRNSPTMTRLVEQYVEARRLQAKLVDLWGTKGVDAETIRKNLDAASKLPVVLDSADEMKQLLKVVLNWQARLEKFCGSCSTTDKKYTRDDLPKLHKFLEEAKTHSFHSKAAVGLEQKLAKVNVLREKIRNHNGTLKGAAPILKDIHKLRLRFAEVNSFLVDHEATSEWVDRANIAIRSRLSLDEVKTLIEQGGVLPMCVEDYITKLQCRVSIADAWLKSFREVIPYETMALETRNVEVIGMIREMLDSGESARLSDISTEGSRVPVDVDFINILHIEFDARNWSAKAGKWIPKTGKQGKLEDLRSHVAKGKDLRRRLPLSDDDKAKWYLQCEVELQAIVADADGWLEAFDHLYEDEESDGCTLECLRDLVSKSDTLFVSLGQPGAKSRRLLAQAEEWYEEHRDLLIKAASGVEKVELAALRSALDKAEENVSVNLVEVSKLASWVEEIDQWIHDVSVILGEQRPAKDKKSCFEVEEFNSLVKNASALPIDVQDQSGKLLVLQRDLLSWRCEVVSEFQRMSAVLVKLQVLIVELYGEPLSFCPTYKLKLLQQPGNDEGTEKATLTNRRIRDWELTQLSDEFEVVASRVRLDPRFGSVKTPETEISGQLDAIARWVSRSMKSLSQSDEVFEERFFGAFDRLLVEGRGLLVRLKGKAWATQPDLQQRVRSLLSEQLGRFSVYRDDRDAFTSASKRAEKMLSNNERRPTPEELRNLLGEIIDPYDNVWLMAARSMERAATTWIPKVRSALADDRPSNLSMRQAETLFSQGEDMGFSCPELKRLRLCLKSAKTWWKKAKKVKSGCAEHDRITTLLEEHESLLISFPEECKRLKQVMKNYCLCRRPHEGYMVECDGCGDWFHGACVGLSKPRGGRVSKFNCIRCGLKDTYKASALVIANAIRKWSGGDGLRRARQTASQRQRRRVRKETKDLEKLQLAASELERLLDKSKTKEAPTFVAGLPQNMSGDVVHQTSSPVTGLASQPSLLPKDVSGYSGTANQDNEVLPAKQQNQFIATIVKSAPAIVSSDSDATGLPSEAELLERRRKVLAKIQLTNTRISMLAAESLKIKQAEVAEDASATLLRRWVLLVRGLVLVPSHEKHVRLGKPGKNGSLSSSMLSLMQASKEHGIDHLEDVRSVENAFGCISWAMLAMRVFRGHPKSTDLLSLVKKANDLQFTNERPLKAVKAMAQRVKTWSTKVSKALAPIPGATSQFDLRYLKELSKAGRDIPFQMLVEDRLHAAMDDGGNRYCLCGGPSDGRFMVGCDQCDQWYHGHCVGVRKAQMAEPGASWKCPQCSGETSGVCVDLKNFDVNFSIDASDDSSESGESSSGGLPEQSLIQWPPFGMLSSESARSVLGDECFRIPDIVECETSHDETVGSTSLAAQRPQPAQQGDTAQSANIFHNPGDPSFAPPNENQLRQRKALMGSAVALSGTGCAKSNDTSVSVTPGYGLSSHETG